MKKVAIIGSGGSGKSTLAKQLGDILSLYRAVKRRVQYNGKTRPDMGEGCDEKIDYQFLKWIWNFRRKNRSEIMKKLNELQQDKQIYIFTSPK